MVEKSKKERKKNKVNEVSDAGICETELGGNDIGIEGCKHSDKEDVKERKNDEGKEKEKKKEKKKKVRKDCYEGIVERKKVNEKGEDLSGEGDQAENVNENLEKKRKKRDKDKTEAGSCYKLQETDFEDAGGNDQLDATKICGNVNQHDKEVETVERVSDEDPVGKVGKKKRKREKYKFVLDEGASHQESTQLIEGGKMDVENQNGEYLEEFNEGYMIEKAEKKKKKRKKGKEMDGMVAAREGILAKENDQRRADSTMNEKQDNNEVDGDTKRKRKKAKSIENGPQDSNSKKGPKKVRFSANVEVFPPSKVVGNETEKNKDAIVRGKRFSKAEDEIVRQAVFNYIEESCLGDEGLDMVLNCRSHPKVKNCWKEIGSAIPYRPYTAVYYRAQVLFRRSKNRKWTQEEHEMVLKFVEQHGAKWKVLADEMGKHRFHVKDAWRRLKVANRKKGRWDQEEYQTLFKLVNKDLVMRLSEEKKSKHGMLRDNIPWSAISEELSSRSDAMCCLKWYKQLTSPMVAEGKWADADDFRLINELYQLDASCIEDVSWDNLLDHRSGDVCRKRWKQMVLHIGQHATKSFAEQVEVLANRYCPDLLDARVAWDNKPVVD